MVYFKRAEFWHRTRFEVEPLSRGVELRVPWTTVALALLFPLAGALFTRSTGASLPLAVLVLAAVLVLVLVVTTFTPFTTAMALRRLWVVFPLGFLLHRGLRRAFIGRWRPELAPQEIRLVKILERPAGQQFARLP